MFFLAASPITGQIEGSAGLSSECVSGPESSSQFPWGCDSRFRREFFAAAGFDDVLLRFRLVSDGTGWGLEGVTSGDVAVG